MRRSKFVVSALVWLLAIGAQAGGEPEDIQALRDLLEPISSLSAAFDQRIQDANGLDIQRSSGHFQIAKPNSLRWIVEQPMPQQVISDGISLWVYDPDLEQVMVQPFQANIQSAPAMLFSGNLEALDSAYRVDKLSGNTFLLTPERGDSLFSSVQIEFDSRQPKSLTLTDNLGQVTHISFGGLVYNPPLAADQFVFDIPAGTDIIRND